MYLVKFGNFSEIICFYFLKMLRFCYGALTSTEQVMILLPLS